MKKTFKAIFVLLLLLVIGGGFLVWNAGLVGSGSIEKWIGVQLQSIVNSYINPQLSFEDIDYEYPGTVRVKNLHIDAPDPANPGQNISIISASGATITLAEIPHVGKPIRISKVILDQPAVLLVSGGKGRLIGFTDLVKPDVIKTTASSRPSEKKLSDILEIRMIRLNDGKVVYDPRIAGAEPMVLDHIWTETDVDPATDGAYDLAIGLNRQPLFSLDARGRFNLDTLEISNMAVQLDGYVGRDREAFLPPQLQKVIEQYKVEGKLNVQFTGSVPLKDIRSADVGFNSRLTRANITTEEFKLPIQRFDIDAQMKNRQLTLSSVSLKALKGSLEASGTVKLNRRLDSKLNVVVEGMHIDDLFVTLGTAEKPKLAGRLNANMNAVVPVSALIVRLAPESTASTRLAMLDPELREPLPFKWGEGQIHLDKGRLVNVPVIEQLSRAIAKTASLMTFKRKAQPTEKADVAFDFMGDQIKISEFTYAGEIVAARGNGAIALDQRLDLTMNGGAIDKLASLLGTKIGDIITTVKPDLLTYRVSGTIDEPKIQVVLAKGRVQDVVVGAGEMAVDGVGKVGKTIGEGAKGLFESLFGK